MLTKLKAVVATVERGRPLAPGHARYLARQFGAGRPSTEPVADDAAHLSASARWIAAAQDSQPDGGVSGRYKLASGWSSSYPETTGYLVPTMLALDREFPADGWKARAERAIAFLLRLQLADGAFPGGEVAENVDKPSPFNTAQILNGLNAWYIATGDARTGEAAVAAARWLRAVQDDDGAFRRHYYRSLPSTYSAHLSCWLAEHGRVYDDPHALDAAGRHLDWVLAQRDPATGWFDLAGFNEQAHAARTSVTHTIAYTVWGVLFMGLALDRGDAVDAAQQAAEGLLRRIELSRWLPGVVDASWKPVEQPACLTGNAQMALIWLKLHETRGDLRFVNAALKAIDIVKRAQDLGNPNPGLRGIGGSAPVWGNYVPMALPNWAAKFFVDALFEKRAALARIA